MVAVAVVVVARADAVVPGMHVVPAAVGGRRGRGVVVAAVDPLAARHLDLAEIVKVRWV